MWRILKIPYRNIFKNVRYTEQSINFDYDQTIELSTGKLARFANGCVTAKIQDTTVMATAVCSKSPSSLNRDFQALTVDYRQKAAASGQIPTSRLRREMAPSEKEIMTARMIDRSLRPLFPKNFVHDVQIMCNLMALNSQIDPDVVSINAASASLAFSDIPWDGPVGAIRVGYRDGQVLVNPTRHDLETSLLNLVVTATTTNKIVMLEAWAKEIDLNAFMKAISQGATYAKKIALGIQKLSKQYGKEKQSLLPVDTEDNYANTKLDLDDQVSTIIEGMIQELAEPLLTEILMDNTHDKISRDDAVKVVRKMSVDSIKSKMDQFGETSEAVVQKLANDAFSNFVKILFRRLIFEKDRRADGRNIFQLRPISSSVDLFPGLHGSSIFQRGQTQVMCTLTFGCPDAAFKFDSLASLLSDTKEKNFMLHYEFPPYATNEISNRPYMVGRRELGHGVLAERALRAIVPPDYPFTIRLSCEVLESNGSSSMASVCAGCLALMDAGVPISKPVSGVAIGLVTKEDPEKPGEVSDHRLLVDIMGMEDYLGDMDFKIAATSKGITALQADVKLAGVSRRIIMEACQKGYSANAQILRLMSETLRCPRDERKECSPVTDILNIPLNKRARFLGIGGYNIKKLSADTGVTITPGSSETVFDIFAPNPDGMIEAKQRIQTFLETSDAPEYEFGEIITGTIVEIRENGVMLELHPVIPPVLLPNSQLDQRNIQHASALGLQVGQELKVKYFGRDQATGRIRISRRALVAVATSVLRPWQLVQSTTGQSGAPDSFGSERRILPTETQAFTDIDSQSEKLPPNVLMAGSTSNFRKWLESQSEAIRAKYNVDLHDDDVAMSKDQVTEANIFEDKEDFDGK